MNLNMIRSKNETEDMLFSGAEKCQTLIEKSHGKTQEVLEFKLDKSKQTYRFNPPNQI